MNNTIRATKAKEHLQFALKELRSFKLTNEVISEISEEMELLTADIQIELESLKV